MNDLPKPLRRFCALYVCALSLSGCLADSATSTAFTSAQPATEPNTPVAISAPAMPSPAMNFADAVQRTRSKSAKLRADKTDVAVKTLEREALEGIERPWLFVGATAARYKVQAKVSTESIQQRIDALGSNALGLLSQVPSLAELGTIPDIGHLGRLLPDDVHLRKKDTYTNAALTAIWPAYSGGRLGAVKTFAGARVNEAESTLRMTEDKLYSTLVERYFGAQLANLAEAVREQALRTIAEHDRMAARFLEEGLIARTERLEASSKLAEAKDQLGEAQNKAKLAAAGLAQLVGADMTHPATALFVNTGALKPLEWYQEHALRHFPGFAKIDAKEAQANAWRTFHESMYKPSVNVFARHDIRAHDADWLVGVHVRYTLFSGIDRSKVIQSAALQLDRVQAVREETQSDIRLLVEKNWLGVHDALARFASYDAQMALAQEQARLASRSFAEGLATALDAMDADTNLARVRTERAKAAYDYVLALSRLLESAGIAETFIDYLLDADVHIDEASL